MVGRRGSKHVLENILPLLIQTHEQLLDALVGKEVVEDLDDQLQLLVEELRGEESPQVRQVFWLSEEAQQRHVELRVVRLKARQRIVAPDMDEGDVICCSLLALLYIL